MLFVKAHDEHVPVANDHHIFLWYKLSENEWLREIVERKRFIALKAFSHALHVACIHKIISGKLPSRKLDIFAVASKTTEVVNTT